MTEGTKAPRATQRKRVLTWHIHGNYLYYLTQVKSHDFYLPVKPGGPEGYGGRAGILPWGENVFEIPADQVAETAFDAILYQSRQNYLVDRMEILSEEQRRHIPQIYLEHDPPLQHPSETKHIVDDPNILIVHVTHFNDLMWNNNSSPSTVIEHGVLVPENARYSGELERGITVVNNIARRGRRTGADVFARARQQVPLDLAGMNADDLPGSIGDFPYQELMFVESRYRFFFNPIRYTSLGLAVCEAMMIGIPVIALATTEQSAVIRNGENGFIDTNIDRLIACMQELLRNPEQAKRLSAAARQTALDRFHIHRFARDWERVLAEI